MYKKETFDLMYKIYNLKDDELDDFISDRLSLLKGNGVKIVGYNSNCYIYNGFFDENVRVNALSLISNKRNEVIFKYAGFIVDDIQIYKCLIHSCKKISEPYLAVSYAVDEYFDLRNEDKKNPDSLKQIANNRDELYIKFSGKDYSVPIDFIRKENLAMCSEIAAVSHNMFKFLGIEADYIVGQKDGEDHSYNMIYPWGRKENGILFDACRGPKSDPHFYYINDENKEKLFSGEIIELGDNHIKTAIDRLFHAAPESCPKTTTKYSISNVVYSDDNKYTHISDTKKSKLIFLKNNKGR